MDRRRFCTARVRVLLTSLATAYTRTPSDVTPVLLVVGLDSDTNHLMSVPLHQDLLDLGKATIFVVCISEELCYV